MSADYDRLFHSSDAAQPEEETASVDRESVAGGASAPMPVNPGRSDPPSGPNPVAPPPTQSAAAPSTAPPPRAAEILSLIHI